MLAYGQTEREEQTPTLEVSNYMVTADSNLDPEWSLDDTNVSSLRRRKVLTDSDRCASPHSSDFNISIYTGISSTFKPTILNEKSMKSRKMITYPKITVAYPRILPNNTIYPKDVNKIKKLDGRYVKPPSSQPPIFLKCKVKKKMENNEDKNSGDAGENNLTLSATTDLDIQFSKVNFEFPSMFNSGLSSRNKPIIASESMNQTLKQYCNFEDKRVMRIAPHIRRKDVICDTVDAWSYSNSSQNSTELCRYKPLIFGGTYPIDLPVKPTSDLRLTKFKDVPMEKSIPKTYDIDVPTDCE